MFKTFLIVCLIVSSQSREVRYPKKGYRDELLRVALDLRSVSNTNSNKSFLEVHTVNQKTKNYDIIFKESPNTNNLEIFDSPNNNTLASFDMNLFNVPENELESTIESGSIADTNYYLSGENLCDVLDKREHSELRDTLGDFPFKVAEMIFPDVNTHGTNVNDCTYEPGTTRKVQRLRAFNTTNPRITLPFDRVWYLLAQIGYTGNPVIPDFKLRVPLQEQEPDYVIMNVVYQVTRV